MSFLGNIIWFVLGGLFLAIGWYVIGLLWCITIIGAPVGVQCFKLGSLALWPFGKDVEYSAATTSVLLNVLWLIFGGFALALSSLVLAGAFCITIIGIPFGLQYFKLAKLSLMPFGAKIKDNN